MNSVQLVGRLVSDPEVKENQDGTCRTQIIIAVSRDFKNTDGLYDADFVKCILWNGVASATKDYCHKGDIVGIRGRIQSHSYETEEKEKKYVTDVVVDKVTFISSNAKKIS